MNLFFDIPEFSLDDAPKGRSKKSGNFPYRRKGPPIKSANIFFLFIETSDLPEGRATKLIVNFK